MSSLPSNSPIKIRVPANFDAVSLAQKHRKRPVDVPLLADRLNWFVSELISVGLRQDKRKEIENSGFVALSTDIFNEIFLSPTTTTEVIKILNGVVFERNDSYQTGQYSKGYQLRSEFLRAGIKSVEITSLPMRKAVRKNWKQRATKQAERTKSVSGLVRCIHDPKLKIDLIKAHNFLEFWAYDLKQKLRDHGSGLDPDLVRELSNRVKTKIYYQKELVRRVQVGEITHSRDESGLRLHSSFTGLKRPLRNLLTYRSQELSSVDVSASQPYLYTRLLQPDFWKKLDELSPDPHTLASLHPDLYNNLSMSGAIDDIIMFTDSLQTHAGGRLQGYSYSEIPWETDYYSLLMYQTQLDFSGNSPVANCYSSRKKTKYHSMLLFFDTKVSGTGTFRVPFKTYFPGALDVMDMIRRTPGIPKKYKGKQAGTAKNNNLPILLQRLESRLILDEICAAILNDYPDLFLLTIHDSIITVKGMEHIVKDYMSRILEKRIGAKPGLKVEPLAPGNVETEWQTFIQEEWNEMVAGMNARKKKNKNGSALADADTQAMLQTLSGLGTAPLVSNLIPKQGSRQILSLNYIDDDLFLADSWSDE